MPVYVGKEKYEEQGRDMPALHSSLQQDHVLEGLPAFFGSGLIGLEGGCVLGRQPEQFMVSRKVSTGISQHMTHDACEHAMCQRRTLPYLPGAGCKVALLQVSALLSCATS